MTKLIDMLLMMVTLESGIARTQSPIRIDQICQSVCDYMIAEYGSKPILRYQSPPNLPTMIGDPDELEELFKQILDNAYRYTPVDGEISVSMHLDGNLIRLQISDTGVGIKPEDLPHIFETFWRADEAHSTPGFGLGLPISQKIVETLGGTIEIKSTIGVGTTVDILLPTVTDKLE